MNIPEEYNNNSLKAEQQGVNSSVNELQLSTNNISESRNLDKVREILFGNQVRDMEKRVGRLEEHLIKELSNVQEETRKRLDALEIYIKQEVNYLTERLISEQLERDTQVKAVAQENHNITMNLEKKLVNLTNKLVKVNESYASKFSTNLKAYKTIFSKKLKKSSLY